MTDTACFILTLFSAAVVSYAIARRIVAAIDRAIDRAIERDR